MIKKTLLQQINESYDNSMTDPNDFNQGSDPEPSEEELKKKNEAAEQQKKEERKQHLKSAGHIEVPETYYPIEGEWGEGVVAGASLEDFEPIQDSPFSMKRLRKDEFVQWLNRTFKKPLADEIMNVIYTLNKTELYVDESEEAHQIIKNNPQIREFLYKEYKKTVQLWGHLLRNKPSREGSYLRTRILPYVWDAPTRQWKNKIPEHITIQDIFAFYNNMCSFDYMLNAEDGYADDF